MLIQWIEKKVLLSATLQSVDAKQRHASPIWSRASFFHPGDVVVVDPLLYVPVPIIIA